MSIRRIRVDHLTRVEGEGALSVRVRNGNVQEVEFRIFEPPRFFEAFLRGRHHTEAPDITARICGICPIAYQMSAVHALEDALGIRVGGQLRALRRLIYCGEWIESHTLHIFMLHAPDFFGLPDAIALAKQHPELVKNALQLKKAGNGLVTLLGGREIHPINVRVGGFYRVPTREELMQYGDTMKRARDIAADAVRWTSKLSFPDLECNYQYVALRHPDEYPFCEGRLVSNRGLDIAVREFGVHFVETQVPHSNALHGLMTDGSPYLVGPLARYNLNFEQLRPIAKELVEECGLPRRCNNPFMSIAVRAVEVLHACDEAIEIIESYDQPAEPFVDCRDHSGIGYGCTEAPRGILYHRYEIDERGIILDAKIVPPTSQNQPSIEKDLEQVVRRYLDLPDDELTHRCEMAIRNYDPCISCATHFLKLDIRRE